jgi:hypothetical protein
MLGPCQAFKQKPSPLDVAFPRKSSLLWIFTATTQIELCSVRSAGVVAPSGGRLFELVSSNFPAGSMAHQQHSEVSEHTDIITTKTNKLISGIISLGFLKLVPTRNGFQNSS